MENSNKQSIGKAVNPNILGERAEERASENLYWGRVRKEEPKKPMTLKEAILSETWIMARRRNIEVHGLWYCISSCVCGLVLFLPLMFWLMVDEGIRCLAEWISRMTTTQKHHLKRTLQGVAIAALFALAFVLSGCANLERKAVAVNIDGAILRVNPSTTELMVGEGTFSFIDSPVKAGQAFSFASEQYDIRSTNLWYKAAFTVTAAADGTACVETGPDPWLRIFGISFYVPWSQQRTTLRYVPEMITNNERNATQ